MSENPYQPPFGEPGRPQRLPARRGNGPWVVLAGLIGAAVGLALGLVQTMRAGSFDDLLDGPRIEHVLLVIVAFIGGSVGAGAVAILVWIIRLANR